MNLYSSFSHSHDQSEELNQIFSVGSEIESVRTKPKRILRSLLSTNIGIDWVRQSCVVDGHIATRSSANPPPNATVVEISADEGGREAEGRGTLHTIRKPSPARFQKTFLLSGMEVSVRPTATESPLLHT